MKNVNLHIGLLCISGLLYADAGWKICEPSKKSQVPSSIASLRDSIHKAYKRTANSLVNPTSVLNKNKFINQHVTQQHLQTDEWELVEQEPITDGLVSYKDEEGVLNFDENYLDSFVKPTIDLDSFVKPTIVLKENRVINQHVTQQASHADEWELVEQEPITDGLVSYKDVECVLNFDKNYLDSLINPIVLKNQTADEWLCLVPQTNLIDGFVDASKAYRKISESDLDIEGKPGLFGLFSNNVYSCSQTLLAPVSTYVTKRLETSQLYIGIKELSEGINQLLKVVVHAQTGVQEGYKSKQNIEDGVNHFKKLHLWTGTKQLFTGTVHALAVVNQTYSAKAGLFEGVTQSLAGIKKIYTSLTSTFRSTYSAVSNVITRSKAAILSVISKDTTINETAYQSDDWSELA